MPTVTAIMQARMGSSRLPGKVLKTVSGKTFLEHSFERLLQSKSIDHCIIATTTEPADDAIVELATHRKWNCYRGSETNVLDRYYQTALKYPSDIIVRVTSDCPLLDPEIIDLAVNTLIDNINYTDYASNTLPPRTYPRGLDVEAFTFKSLKQAWQKATDLPHLEHVTPYINSQPEIFNSISIQHSSDQSRHRWTLDTSEDHELLSKILNAKPNPTHWLEILELVANNPGWEAINATIEQKKI
ncbi:MAG: glycosyltransferase family protein [Rubritalea sp.]|jgi:spore coat polysaccharide biosynthesis protein SpsF|tara:strand:- start:3227 stop:3955 length:729 start_codon:yes stop_codon:yes gene_type:complete